MLVIDVETIPLASSIVVPFDRASATPPANYKSPEAIAKWLDGAEADYTTARVKQCSINPRLGRVLSLAYSFGDETRSIYAATEADEADLLRLFWGLCLDAHSVPLVTWNGAFDLRWLIVRSIAHNLTPTVGTTGWFKRYAFYPHCDVKAFLLNEWGSKVAGEGLDEWAAFAGLAGKGDLDGSKVYEAFLAGKHDEIAQYNKNDVETTLALFRRIQPYL